MENNFKIIYDKQNGGVSAIINECDEYQMNWAEGNKTWGIIKDSEFISCEDTNNGIKSLYKTRNLDITVFRGIIDGKYKETYIFKNRLDCDVFFLRGQIGIYATFNDNYETADICMTNRCHTHIWCGDEVSYIDARKMGPCNFALGLVLTRGSLDTYSVERKCESEDRGDFIFHPSPFHLMSGEEMVLSWELFWHDDGDFYDTVSQAILIDAENYTVFKDEHIKFSVNRTNAKIELKGELVSSHSENGRTYVDYEPSCIGEHRFYITADGKTTYCEFYVQIPFRELVKRRVEFITQKQQFICGGSPIDGAYLIYDNEDESVYFDNLDGDMNASRERLVMGLLVAKYLQYYKDEKIYESLMKYYKYVTREFYNEETGEVYDTIGMNPTRKRLYNAPWMSMLVMEMYKLTGDENYLDKMYKLLCVYYTIGGEKFYPNGLTMLETYEVLKNAGRSVQAEKLLEMYKIHVNNIVKIGTDYPIHEVKFEQTIASPGTALLVQMCMITGDKSLIAESKKQVKILERFNGSQPSYKLNNLAIRHWDAFYFGKRKNFGDTFPHVASIHSSDALLHGVCTQRYEKQPLLI